MTFFSIIEELGITENFWNYQTTNLMSKSRSLLNLLFAAWWSRARNLLIITFLLSTEPTKGAKDADKLSRKV